MLVETLFTHVSWRMVNDAEANLVVDDTPVAKGWVLEVRDLVDRARALPRGGSVVVRVGSEDLALTRR